MSIGADLFIISASPNKSIKTGEMIDVIVQTKDEKIIAKIERMNPGFIWVVDGIGRLVISSTAAENINNADYVEIKSIFIPIRQISKDETITVAQLGKINFKDIEVTDDGLKAESIKVIQTTLPFSKMVLFIICMIAGFCVVKLTLYFQKKMKLKNEIKAKKARLLSAVSSINGRAGVELLNQTLNNDKIENPQLNNEIKIFQEHLNNIQYKKEWTENELAQVLTHVKKITQVIEEQ
jgi:hypothetical protein